MGGGLILRHIQHRCNLLMLGPGPRWAARQWPAAQWQRPARRVEGLQLARPLQRAWLRRYGTSTAAVHTGCSAAAAFCPGHDPWMGLPFM